MTGPAIAMIVWGVYTLGCSGKSDAGSAHPTFVCESVVPLDYVPERPETSVGCVDLSGLPVEELGEPCGGVVCAAGDEVTSQDELAVYEGCTDIVGDLEIEGGDLEHLDQLYELRCVHGTLSVSSAANLVSLAGLEDLACVAGDFHLTALELTSLAGLESLESVGGLDLSCPRLANLDALSGLKEIVVEGRALYIRDGEELESIAGLSNVSYVGGYIEIRDNPVLESLSGLENIPRIHWVELRRNASLADLSALACRARMDIIVVGKHAFDNLTWLTGLERSSWLQFGEIYEDQASSIRGVPNLKSLAGLESLKRVGYLRLLGAGHIENLEPLANLRIVKHDLHISGNEELVSLHGLERLEHIGGDLIIGNRLFEQDPDTYEASYECWGNDQLKNVDGLSGLTRIDDFLDIKCNKRLENLDGLDALTHVGVDIWIERNKRLPTCEATELVERLMDEGWDEERCIEHNADDECTADAVCDW